MEIKSAKMDDLDFLAARDGHIRRDELSEMIGRGRVLLAREAGETAGYLRWNLFWDNTPFLNMLYVFEPHRGQGCGRRLVAAWEAQMRAAGYGLLMTSTLSDETAQHFYRKLGYKDAGCLLLPGEALEIFFVKRLAAGD